MYKNTLFVVAFISVIASSIAIKWVGCDDASKKLVSNVQVSGCGGTDPECKIKKGTNATFTVDFTSTDKTVTSAKAVVHGVLAGVPIPFPISNPDGCKNCGLTCPLKASTKYSYHDDIFVKPIYPLVDVTVKWELQDQSGADLWCVYVKVAIVD